MAISQLYWVVFCQTPGHVGAPRGTWHHYRTCNTYHEALSAQQEVADSDSAINTTIRHVRLWGSHEWTQEFIDKCVGV